MVIRKYEASTWLLSTQTKATIVNGNYLPFSEQCGSGQSCFSISEFDNGRVRC
jgi:hypothetical protein